jgi:ApeA N-terminal domain 1
MTCSAEQPASTGSAVSTSAEQRWQTEHTASPALARRTHSRRLRVRDANGQALAYIYSRDNEAEARDLAGFEAWFWFRSIVMTREENRISAEWRRSDAAVYRFDDETLIIEFDVVGRIPYGSLADEIALKERATARITLVNRESLEQLRNRFQLLKDPLILLVDTEPHRLSWPKVSLEKGSEATWYFGRVKNDEVFTKPELHECLTFVPHLRERFGEIWSNWKTKRDEFGPGFYFYLGTRRGLNLYVEHTFVNLIWGIEAFHRIKYPTKSDRLLPTIERIVGQVADDGDRS